MSAQSAARAECAELDVKNITWSWIRDTTLHRQCLSIRGDVGESTCVTCDWLYDRDLHCTTEPDAVLDSFVYEAVNHFLSAADTLVRAQLEQSRAKQSTGH